MSITGSCLIVNLTGRDLTESIRQGAGSGKFAMPAKLAISAEQAVKSLTTADVLVMAIFADGPSSDLNTVLKEYQANLGVIPEFQLIICDEPDPNFMTAVYEFGIEQFATYEQWVQDLAAVQRHATEKMQDPESSEYKCVHLTRTIKGVDQAAIEQAEASVRGMAEYDFRIAFASGKALEATGKYDEAINTLKGARTLNKRFRPASSSLGEVLVATGRVDEAIEIFQQLEATNPHSAERKANLAAAYVEKGDFAKAQEYASAAASLAPESSVAKEAQAQILLGQGKVGEAFAMMDSMSQVGPFFAAKLNDMGVKLSKAGKAKSAIALYNKAHKIVRQELKYKISLNAALACRRMGAFDLAIQYVDRCEKEYGKPFAKLDKIRSAIVAESQGAQQDKKGVA